MKLSQLRNLVAVADAGSMRQAARNLHLSQSAITKSIQQLEAQLGAELLRRSSHGVEPTETGKALLSRAKSIEAELRHARNEVETIAGGTTGEIRVSASPTVTSGLLPKAVLSFKRTRPGITFYLEEGVYPDVLSSVRMGEVDFAICLVSERLVDETLTMEILVKDRLTPAVRRDHPLTQRGKLALADLADADWIIYRRSRTGRDIFERTFVANGLEPPKSTIECTSFACALKLIENSDHVTLVPMRVFDELPKGGPIRPLHMEAPTPPWNVAAIYRANHALSKVCQAFLDELRSVASGARG